MYKKDKYRNKLWCDLNTDIERIEFIECSRAHESGIIAKSMEQDIIRAFRENIELKKGVESVRGLIDESEGVAGLHLNGDIAKWSDLEDDWLVEFKNAERI